MSYSNDVKISENVIQTTSTSQIATQISIDNSVIPEQNEIELFEFNPSVAANIVSQIISSNSISDVDNNMRMNWLTNQFAEASDDKLKENFNEQFQITIRDNLGSCQSVHEIALLDIIEIIAERGTNMPLEGGFYNQRMVFFDSMESSGLLEKIENMICEKIYSRACLACISDDVDENGYEQLIKLNYVKAMSEYTGNSGGNLNENADELWCGILGIQSIFRELRYGRKQTHSNPSLKPQPKFIPVCQEQVEEVGGLEEIESNLFRNGWKLTEFIDKVRIAMFLYFKDSSNCSIWDYELQ
ncbi:MAG: hypothetical protein EZS28_016427 [Streblomastix strix]|uniref:Uncharacterized protein n=1 Tax=Streblomastix strix TaxID=222440 RepID=A0A5J4VZF6_9EUKA|nr:MAG: hypothetical protein EZS28_016427 [Streblomastix strix]